MMNVEILRASSHNCRNEQLNFEIEKYEIVLQHFKFYLSENFSRVTGQELLVRKSISDAAVTGHNPVRTD